MWRDFCCIFPRLSGAYVDFLHTLCRASACACLICVCDSLTLTTLPVPAAIREDRTRGGRSTYQCTYQVPPALVAPSPTGGGGGVNHGDPLQAAPHVKQEPGEAQDGRPPTPPLLKVGDAMR